MNNKAPTALSRRLKELRTMNGITQKQLATATGISYASIVDYENGRREPNSKAMAALERYFHCNGEYIRGEVSHQDRLASYNERIKSIESITNQTKAFLDDIDYAPFTNAQIANSLLISVLKILRDCLLHSDKSVDLDENELCSIFQNFFELNASGRSELAKRANELMQLEQYRLR